MSRFNILGPCDPEILLNDTCATEWHLRVGAFLYSLKFRSQVGYGIIGRVANEEGEIDEVMGVGQLGDEVEVISEVVGGVPEGSEN